MSLEDVRRLRPIEPGPQDDRYAYMLAWDRYWRALGDEMERLAERAQGKKPVHPSTVSPPATRTIRLAEPSWGEEEIEAVVAVLRSGQVTSGEKVRELEIELEMLHPGHHAVCCNSGSSANLLAVAERFSPLREEGRLIAGNCHVGIPALCWSTTVWPWIQYGATPVIFDIDPDSLNIDVEKIKGCGLNLNAVMPVSVYGNAVDFKALKNVEGFNSWALIEDACESAPVTTAHAEVVVLRRTRTYSFYFSHHMTSIEGGAVLTPDPLAAERMRVIRGHGWIRDCVDRNCVLQFGWRPHLDPVFTFVDAGYNLRMNELQAAIGLAQLRKLPEFVVRRSRIAGRLISGLSHLGWLRTQAPRGPYHHWFGFPVVVHARTAPTTTAYLRDVLKSRGIETRPLIAGNIARQPALQHYNHVPYGDLPVADDIMRNGFALPCHQGMSDEDVDHILKVFDEIN